MAKMTIETPRVQRVTSFEEYLRAVEEFEKIRMYSGHQWVIFYRGHSLDSYELKSVISRHFSDIIQLEKIEKRIFRDFKLAVKVGMITNILLTDKNSVPSKINQDWESLFQAQHLGVPTRMLDWSIDRRMGLLFAVENDEYHGRDGHVWLYVCPRENNVNSGNLPTLFDHSPFDTPDIYMINYPFYHTERWRKHIGEVRRARQAGRFTIRNTNTLLTPIDRGQHGKWLFKIIIDGNSKDQIKQDLEARGYTIDWAYYKSYKLTDIVVQWIKDKNLSKSPIAAFKFYTLLFLFGIIYFVSFAWVWRKNNNRYP